MDAPPSPSSFTQHAGPEGDFCTASSFAPTPPNTPGPQEAGSAWVGGASLAPVPGLAPASSMPVSPIHTTPGPVMGIPPHPCVTTPAFPSPTAPQIMQQGVMGPPMPAPFQGQPLFYAGYLDGYECGYQCGYEEGRLVAREEAGELFAACSHRSGGPRPSYSARPGYAEASLYKPPTAHTGLHHPRSRGRGRGSRGGRGRGGSFQEGYEARARPSGLFSGTQDAREWPPLPQKTPASDREQVGAAAQGPESEGKKDGSPNQNSNVAEG